jgi:hypothetical protein
MTRREFLKVMLVAIAAPFLGKVKTNNGIVLSSEDVQAAQEYKEILGDCVEYDPTHVYLYDGTDVGTWTRIEENGNLNISPELIEDSKIEVGGIFKIAQVDNMCSRGWSSFQMTTEVGEDGGFLLPEEISRKLIEMVNRESPFVVLGTRQEVKTENNHGRWGGFHGYWVENRKAQEGE